MERPIILKAHEVRGILDGRQTQLRRIIKPQPNVCASEVIQMGDEFQFGFYEYIDNERFGQTTDGIWCPFGQVGDRLWGKETWATSATENGKNAVVCYKSNGQAHAFHCEPCEEPTNWLSPFGGFFNTGFFVPKRWKSSQCMPRWASRILLEIVSVRVERLLDISQDDAKASGFLDGGCLTCGASSYPIPCGCHNPRPDYVDSFAWQWRQCHGEPSDKSWWSNPFVWVLTFKRVKNN